MERKPSRNTARFEVGVEAVNSPCIKSGQGCIKASGSEATELCADGILDQFEGIAGAEAGVAEGEEQVLKLAGENAVLRDDILDVWLKGQAEQGEGGGAVRSGAGTGASLALSGRLARLLARARGRGGGGRRRWFSLFGALRRGGRGGGRSRTRLGLCARLWRRGDGGARGGHCDAKRNDIGNEEQSGAGHTKHAHMHHQALCAL